MTIDEAIKILEISSNETGSQAELKLKQRFGNILHELKNKDFTPAQQEILEKELDLLFSDLDLNSKNSQKELKKRLNRFIKNLRVKFSLIPEGYCAGNGMIFGIIVGSFVLAISIVYTDSVLKYYAPLAGLILGMLIGSILDREIKKQGRTLLTKMY